MPSDSLRPVRPEVGTEPCTAPQWPEGVTGRGRGGRERVPQPKAVPSSQVLLLQRKLHSSLRLRPRSSALAQTQDFTASFQSPAEDGIQCSTPSFLICKEGAVPGSHRQSGQSRIRALPRLLNPVPRPLWFEWGCGGEMGNRSSPHLLRPFHYSSHTQYTPASTHPAPVKRTARRTWTAGHEQCWELTSAHLGQVFFMPLKLGPPGC